MNFERNINPKKSLGIGRSQKRLFKNIEEIIEWGVYFPSEYSEGRIYSWFDKDENGKNYFDFRNGTFDKKLDFPNPPSTERQSALLFFVKWFRRNVHLEDYPEDAIGLKECKTIVDGIASRINEIYNEEIEDLHNQILEKLSFSKICQILEKLKNKYSSNEN